jgi:hypothetical protein
MAGHVSRQICIGVKNLFNQKFGSSEESTKKKIGSILTTCRVLASLL